MRKLFGMLALGVACMGLAACGEKPSGVDKNKVWEQSIYEEIHAFGNNQVEVNNEDVANDWAVKDFNKMTAISLAQLEAIDANVEKALESKELIGLYKLEGLVLGAKDAGWEASYKNASGEIVKANGSYAVKACGVDKNEDNEWVKTCHFTSPESHGYSLTPSTLWITDNMTDQKIDGFDHDSNPVALAAGKYTFVAALFKDGTSALGLFKTGNRDPYVAPTTYPITSMSVAGDFNSWGDEEMANVNGTFVATITVAADKLGCKVKLNKDWKYSLGAHALEATEYQDNDGNITLPGAGTYEVKVALAASAMADFETSKEIVVFTILPANNA